MSCPHRSHEPKRPFELTASQAIEAIIDMSRQAEECLEGLQAELRHINELAKSVQD